MVTIHDARMILRKKQEIKDANEYVKRRRRLMEFKEHVKHVNRCGVTAFRFYDYEMLQKLKRALDINPGEIRDVLRSSHPKYNRTCIVRQE